MLKTGLNRPLRRQILEKLDECEGRMSELLIDSATDESEANSPKKQGDATRKQRGSDIPVQNSERNDAIGDGD